MVTVSDSGAMLASREQGKHAGDGLVHPCMLTLLRDVSMAPGAFGKEWNADGNGSGRIGTDSMFVACVDIRQMV